MAVKILWAVVISFFIGQTIKAFLHYHQYKKVNLWVYFEDGGMPSTHSVTTFALTTAIFYETGVSIAFMISLVFTLIMLNDTMKVRRERGVQSELMSRFVDFREVFRRKLTESIGHTPGQVFVGALIGFLVSSILYAF